MFLLQDIDYGQLMVLMGYAKTASVVRNECKHCWPMLPTGFELMHKERICKWKSSISDKMLLLKFWS
jgi:hypothetical protein